MAEIDILEVPEPLIVPFVDDAGNVMVPLKVSVCPFKFKTPFVWVKAPETVKAVPKFRVCPLLFRVKLLSVNPPVVKNSVLLILPADINRLEAAVPVIVPFEEAAGKTTVPLNVRVCPFRLTIPLVWV